jgi:hypothetical protein
MTKLKMLATIAASTMAVSGLAMTTAQAQPWRGDGRLNTSYVDGESWKIDNAARQGAISWGQARELHRELASVQPLAWRVQTGQAGPYEVRRLEGVVNHIDSMTSGYAYNTRRDGRDHDRYDHDRYDR